jgi:hypothetical protein
MNHPSKAATHLTMAFQYDNKDGGVRECSAMTFFEWQERDGRFLLDRSCAAAERWWCELMRLRDGADVVLAKDKA